MAQFVTVDTKPFEGQLPGTSGLRKKVTVFQQQNYVENFVQATFDALAEGEGFGGIPEVLAVGGDGRYLSEPVCQTIIRMAAANGVKKVVCGKGTLMSTPAVSAVVRTHVSKPTGAFILTASHNPGGPKNDFGMKYNCANGGPAPEKVTNLIYTKTTTISKYKTLNGVADFDLNTVGTQKVTDGVTLEVVDSVSLYADYMATIFDFDAIKKLVARADFTMYLDAMHGAAGPYAKRVFVDMLGAKNDSVRNVEPLPDFGGGHPDPNLTYAHDLVHAMGLNEDGSINAGHASHKVPDFGAAWDGDADRNMVIGSRFFVSPSDSVAIIAANAAKIPYFKKLGGLKAVARSMPTSGALDLVAKALNVPFFEVPTGWKFFGNLMDSAALFGKQDYTPLICGEESFGTGSSHVREKDGVWATLAWLNIIAAFNQETEVGHLVTVKAIVEEHWRQFGRNYYCRYDYEEIDAGKAKELMAAIREAQPKDIPALPSGTTVKSVDDFSYNDPVDGSVSKNQGVRVVYEDGSRFVLRLSGTGSVGATLRLYLEQYVNADEVKKMLSKPDGMPSSAEALGPLVQVALQTVRVKEFTGRDKPTVIT